MKEFLLLKLLDFAAGILKKKAGNDYFQLRMILKVKLTLDSRNIPTLLSGTKNIEKKNIPLLSMLMYGFMGLMMSVFVWIPFSTFYKMNIILGMIIFMILATMISDFSTVLLDVRDKSIFLSRPIEEKTIRLAKTIHIMYYLLRITLTLSGPTIIMCLFKYGLGFSLVLLLEIILICGFVLFLTSILYYVILSLFDGEKLKDIINYFQIALTIFMAIAYQFISRMFEVSRITVSFTPKWWNYLLPTTWFASPLSLLTEKDYTHFYMRASILAIIIPTIAFIAYVKYIIPYFEKNLQKLNNNNGKKRKKSRGSGLQKLMPALACSDQQERAVFKFTNDMIASERKLKLQLYPSLAFAVIMPFIFMFISFSKDDFFGTLKNLKHGNSFLSVYLCIAMASITVFFISKSEKFKSAWIYKVLPVGSPSVILKGALKAFIFKYNIPLAIFMSAVIILFYGPRIIPDVILMIANMFLLLLSFFRISAKQLPFSKDFQNMQQGTNTGLSFALLFMAGFLALIHYGVTFLPFGVTANIAVSIIISAVLWHSSFKISWRDIESNT